ncbi:hypothetical protein AcV7_005748 [Taiwanofungus camphoratus]|nr:hypothetical protein AcV7_005748 [Antrodia cinnamomea]
MSESSTMVGSGQPDTQASTILHTRGYQQELLEESLRSNLIIALDTGSGKTHIAVLRMKLEAEREAKKVSWFLAPTVALVEQQRDVIEKYIPVPVGKISGASEPGQWKDPVLWRNILDTYRIMVTTPQVLLDALLHSYVDLGSDIGLLVFDEAHHAVLKHPYNMIMSQFYFSLPRRSGCDNSNSRVRPMILGLTASPIYGGNVDASFQALEGNLDSTIRSSRANRDELADYVHRPVFKHILYPVPDYSWEDLPSRNYRALKWVVHSLNIEDDPYVKSLRSQLKRAQPGNENRTIDQKLSKTISKEDTFTHKGLKDFTRTAQEIGMELGSWAADWYVAKVIEKAKIAANPYNNMMSAWQEKEKSYLLAIISQVHLAPVSFDPNIIYANTSAKVHKLIDCLITEEADARAQEEAYSGLVFVTRRDTVLALTEVLSRLPKTANLFRIGCLIGSSSSFKRHSFLDITREMAKDSQGDTLRDFKIGDKNLIVSTSVAEEGIDIQACGSVIRFDPPANVVGWAQSRGRARRKRSSFVIMFEDGGVHEKVIKQWEDTEMRMMALYNDSTRDLAKQDDENEDLTSEDHLEYIVPSTGAVLTLDSATSHLNHFCAILPNSGYNGHVAIYDLDPPDFPEGWHSDPKRVQGLPSYEGPWGATVSLPRALPQSLRSFSTERIHYSKRSAQRHAAFKAYVELHKAGLLNDNLLPLTSAIEPDKGEEVKKLLEEIEKRASTTNVSIQMDPWTPEADEDKWWSARLVIEGLPALHILTRNPLPDLTDEAPLLFVPGQKHLKVIVRPIGALTIEEDCINRARDYTYRLFATLYSPRMEPGDTSFSYLFLPEADGIHEPLWHARREWMRCRIAGSLTVHPGLESIERANAEALGKQFSFPADLALIRPNNKFGKAVRFVGWVHETITTEEEEELVERYEGFPDLRITYPLLLVKPFPQRTNFLVPLEHEMEGLGHEEPFLLHPKYATVDLVSQDDVQYAMLLPSILRSLTNALTVVSLREKLLSQCLVTEAPLSLLTTAVTAPVSQEPTNYQRLETLGDTVLKFITSVQIFAEHPLWHEGYLARRKDHAVSNVRLAQEAIAKRLYQWIIRDRFVPRKWRPRYIADRASRDVKIDAVNASDEKKKKKQTQELSTKVLADVVESLLGAAYEHGSFGTAVDCAKMFGLGLPWEPLPVRVGAMLANTEELQDPPTQLKFIEQILGYEFSCKALLVQALTHASYHGELTMMSYERLEFLGDSALDMVVTDYLYHAPGKSYSPGHMHLRKEAVVNSHFLAFICLNSSIIVDTTMPSWSTTAGLSLTSEGQEKYLWQFLLHSSHRVLEDLNLVSARFEKIGPSIHDALLNDAIYPWAALTSLQAPKFISDMIESLLGAAYLDSKGDLDTVRAIMKKLGIIEILERIVECDVDVLHPVSRLAMWADTQRPRQKVAYEIQKSEGNVSCAIMLDGSEIVNVSVQYRSRASQEEVKFAAAEQAIKKLRILDVEEEQPDWGDDVPEYDW